MNYYKIVHRQAKYSEFKEKECSTKKVVNVMDDIQGYSKLSNLFRQIYSLFNSTTHRTDVVKEILKLSSVTLVFLILLVISNYMQPL